MKAKIKRKGVLLGVLTFSVIIGLLFLFLRFREGNAHPSLALKEAVSGETSNRFLNHDPQILPSSKLKKAPSEVNPEEITFKQASNRLFSALPGRQRTGELTPDEKHHGDREGLFSAARGMVAFMGYLRSHPEQSKNGLNALKHCALSDEYASPIRALCTARAQKFAGGEELLSVLDHETLNLLHHFKN